MNFHCHRPDIETEQPDLPFCLKRAFSEAGAYFAGADYAYFLSKMSKCGYLDEPVVPHDILIDIIGYTPPNAKNFALLNELVRSVYDCARYGPFSCLVDEVQETIKRQIADANCDSKVAEGINNCSRMLMTFAAAHAAKGISTILFAANDFNMDRTLNVLTSTPDAMISSMASLSPERLETVINMFKIDMTLKEAEEARCLRN